MKIDLYRNEKMKFDLYRDGSWIMTGTEIEVMGYIHRKHTFSLIWATMFEGYTCRPAQK